MRILVCGWSRIPHSYAIVLVSEIVHLYKNHHKDNNFKLYLKEEEYFNIQWNKKLRAVFPNWYHEILQSIKPFNNERIDVVYTITYPYNLTPYDVNGRTPNEKEFNQIIVPKLVFYTSEFGTLDNTYFSLNGQGIRSIANTLKELKQNYDDYLYFKAPSKWSQMGMLQLGYHKDKNIIISHGIDTDIFKPVNTRKQMRTKYNFSDNDIVMIVSGSLTGNKGVKQILWCLNELDKNGITNFKLVLKGSDDLYPSKQLFNVDIEKLKTEGLTNVQNIVDKYVIYLGQMFSFETMNHIYNMCDLYISPYLCEGFGLCPLEFLTTGGPILLPKTGATVDYSTKVKNAGFQHMILEVDSEIVTINNKKQNKINNQDLYNVLFSYNNSEKIHSLRNESNSTQLRLFLRQEFGWDNMSEQLYNHFKTLIY